MKNETELHNLCTVLETTFGRGRRVGVKSSDSPNITCPGCSFHSCVHQALANVPNWAWICVRQAAHENLAFQNVLFSKAIGCSERATSKLGEAVAPSVQREAKFQNVLVFFGCQFSLHQDLCCSSFKRTHQPSHMWKLKLKALWSLLKLMSWLRIQCLSNVVNLFAYCQCQTKWWHKPAQTLLYLSRGASKRLNLMLAYEWRRYSYSRIWANSFWLRMTMMLLLQVHFKVAKSKLLKAIRKSKTKMSSKANMLQWLFTIQCAY